MNSSNQLMTLYGEDFDFSTEANDRIGLKVYKSKAKFIEALKDV